MIKENEVVSLMQEEAYKPMSYKELEKHFGIGSANEFKDFIKMLNQLEESGHIVRSPNDRYGVPERMNLVRGKLQAHAKGFAFLIPEDREHPDVYINAHDLNTAMNGDIVFVKVTSRSQGGGRLEGEVVRVITRANSQIVGVFQSQDTYAFVIADDKRVTRDIFIPQHAFMGAVSGQKVVVKIVNYPEGRSAAEGEVIEILGHKDDPGVDILAIIRKHQLPEAFQPEVLAEAEAAPDSITEEEIIGQGRRDLRAKTIVTIDGEDAKDLDDAVNVELLENGNLRLGVHIADVSYYVREGTALDIEAYNRGCSVYLTDRVIPMLPHRLSNGICSLNPQVDRLTMSCEMEFDADLKVVNHEIFTSVIKTKERMTYTNVRKLLTGEAEPEIVEKYAYLMEDFKRMEELAARLRSRRMKRGAIDFDFEESKILVDAEGKPTDIVKRERSVAEMMIEEFMLAANETVAEHFSWLKVPFLYRVHEDPDSEKLMNFMEFVTTFGYAMRGGKGGAIHARSLQALLEDIKGSPEETVISKVMLRSMKQAKYDAQSLGHFGLAAEFYSHFTSPIRRYPDLVIHRVIREVLENGGTLPDIRHDYLASRMNDIAQQSSERERVAVDAERDTEALKKAQYMLDKVGEEFEGIISSVTGFGMFIELDNTVEGLIRLSDLTDDYYNHHEKQHALIGERTSKIYRLGDSIKVRVARVSMEDHTIDFELLDMKPRKEGAFNRGGGGGGKFKGAGGFKGFRGKSDNGRSDKGKGGTNGRPEKGKGGYKGKGGFAKAQPVVGQGGTTNQGDASGNQTTGNPGKRGDSSGAGQGKKRGRADSGAARRIEMAARGAAEGAGVTEGTVGTGKGRRRSRGKAGQGQGQWQGNGQGQGEGQSQGQGRKDQGQGRAEGPAGSGDGKAEHIAGIGVGEGQGKTRRGKGGSKPWSDKREKGGKISEGGSLRQRLQSVGAGRTDSGVGRSGERGRGVSLGGEVQAGGGGGAAAERSGMDWASGVNALAKGGRRRSDDGDGSKKRRR
ncbi:Ribonuclease R [Paenibacillus allorhizoplanae]|uniref:Ribonuclease R n=1 Tax=Paenibacillus allorhizoplanae TaxID=2905648 RepID=A0ABN8HAF4_9BACL|nr:ribonuclease R [Paenibacillus allorhizoplanae]CAH1229793.1 Ribonuclease R [Paenibacillus allorhizoplanae]